MAKKSSIFCSPTLLAILAVLAAVWGFLLGHKIDLKVQLAFTDGLLNIAAIFFGIIGAWFALVYPDALKQIIKVDSVDTKEQSQRVHSLYLPLYISTAVIALILVGRPSIVIVQEYWPWDGYAECGKRLLFGIILGLSAAEIIALFQCLYPFYLAHREIKSAQSQRDVDDNFSKNSAPAADDDGDPED